MWFSCLFIVNKFVHIQCWHTMCIVFFSLPSLSLFIFVCCILSRELCYRLERGWSTTISSSHMMTIIRYDCYSLIQSSQNHHLKLQSSMLFIGKSDCILLRFKCGASITMNIFHTFSK